MADYRTGAGAPSPWDRQRSLLVVSPVEAILPPVLADVVLEFFGRPGLALCVRLVPDKDKAWSNVADVHTDTFLQFFDRDPLVTRDCHAFIDKSWLVTLAVCDAVEPRCIALNRPLRDALSLAPGYVCLVTPNSPGMLAAPDVRRVELKLCPANEHRRVGVVDPESLRSALRSFVGTAVFHGCRLVARREGLLSCLAEVTVVEIDAEQWRRVGGVLRCDTVFSVLVTGFHVGPLVFRV